jgi:ABC-type nitrate/sulfonate/bicarbonate transport system substrate-binding protein
MLRFLVAGCLLCAAFFTSETHGQAPAPLRAAGNMTTIELSPLLVAADGIYRGEISVINGGIPAIMSGMVDVATNAETQLLRQSVDDPDLRVIFTVAEGLYRIVARKSAGIRRIADLKGKRITTPRNTSAHYFLVKMLATGHLSEADVTLVTINPTTDMSTALKDGRVDAVVMWEPESDRAFAAVGPDAIVFDGRGVYRELFNLNTSAKVLADPLKRRAVVELLRSLVTASEKIRQRPRQYWPLIAAKLNYTTDTVSTSWPHLRYAGGLAPDLLDVMAEEEIWVARERNRTPRTRSQLASLIDGSLLAEALRH